MPRLDHINIHTRDPARMRDFLALVLGIKEGFRPPFPNPGHWLYFDGEDHAAIHLDVIEAEIDFPLGIVNHAAFAFLIWAGLPAYWRRPDIRSSGRKFLGLG